MGTEEIPIVWSQRGRVSDDDEKLHHQLSSIDIFERIVNGNDDSFPKHLNMFNVLMVSLCIYRAHCRHIQVSKQVSLKCRHILALICRLTEEFFMDFEHRQHVRHFIVAFYYFASPDYDY